MRVLAICACSLSIAAVLGQVAVPSKREQKVRAWLAADKPYKAINQCNAMLGGKTPAPVFYALRADARNRIGEYLDAERDARAGLAAFPGSKDALFQLALAEHGLGRYDSAVIHFDILLAEEASAEYRYRAALALRAKGDHARAIARLDEALRSAEGAASAKFHRVKGECLAAMGDTTASRVEFDRAIELAPEDPVNYNSRGWFLYAAFGDHPRAIADYDRAIRRNPNYSYAFNNRGWSYYRVGNKDKALRDINMARRKKVFNPFTYRNLGIIALESGDRVAACMHFRRALDYNFTAVHGDEVQRLVEANCVNENNGNAPVQAPNAPIDRPMNTPPSRTNAP